MEGDNHRFRPAVVILIALVIISTIPIPVAAQSGAQAGGTVVVEEGETVDELESFAGTVIVRGTVTGDVSAVAGDVTIASTGTVEGDLESAAGSVTIAGVVNGDVEIGAGSVEVTRDGTVGGTFTAGAGNVVVDGVLEGNAEIGAETIRLGETASIAGDLRYDGDLEGNTDSVAGSIEEDSSLGVDVAPTVQPFAWWIAAVYTLVVNLLLGAVLLALFPRFSDSVASTVATGPFRSGLIGLGVFVGIPVLLIALAITIVGIPLSIVGAIAFAFLLWIATVYGWFAVAAGIFRAVGIGNRWLALVVGLVVGAAVSRVPIVGGLLTFLVLLLGLGAIARGLYGHRRNIRERDRGQRVGPGSDEPTTD
ncbi:bactofilin family protein [Natrinema halophilum]|uniref:Polymer-forming cytoskeletal protein n=1 Tax=Natrinema halophilum TaxID=1699371 RepID=A0A7D5L3G7_9EURY|nr:polymer-forming cytoskeletal protein [Natrinema halophilum]QLG49785.1 polymer-forming cytoskeletal protein [Natrinema halophilum]